MATTRENKTISQFKSQLIGGGARPNLFEVELTTLPAGLRGPQIILDTCVKQHSYLHQSLLISTYRLEVVFLKLLVTEQLKTGQSQ